MTIKQLIKIICDGDNNKHRDKVNIRILDKWYKKNM